MLQAGSVSDSVFVKIQSAESRNQGEYIKAVGKLSRVREGTVVFGHLDVHKCKQMIRKQDLACYVRRLFHICNFRFA